MRILLTTLNAKYIHTNLAVRLLYGLNRDFKGLEMREFTIKESQDEVAAACAEFDVVCFSCYIWNITQTLEVGARIKRINPEAKILLGGPEVSYEWEKVMALPQVDFIITGEGEIPFRAFLENYPDTSKVPNLACKENGEVQYRSENTTFDLKAYEDLMPYAFDDPETLKNRVLYIETSRGCPYKCEFCLASLDNKVRYLPDRHIKSTLLHLMQHGRVIKFLDRTFNIKRDFTLDIFRFILEHHRPENVFQFEITADILHPEITQFIRENVPDGLFRFEIGIQTVNQKANLEVSRKQNFEKTKAVVQSLADKVEMHLDLIVGLPLDYWDDVKYSIEEVFKLYPPELQLGFLKFLKGTPVRYKEAQHGFVFDPEPPYQIIESNYLSRDQLHRIELVENALEIYWNKKRAENTLRYASRTYGIFDFLLGLGIRFSETKPFYQYTLSDIYQILADFALRQYPDDAVLRQMIAADYFLQYKIKPGDFMGAALSGVEKNGWVKKLGLNHHKFRHVILPLSFDFQLFKENDEIVFSDCNLIVQYNGVDRPDWSIAKNIRESSLII